MVCTELWIGNKPSSVSVYWWTLTNHIQISCMLSRCSRLCLFQFSRHIVKSFFFLNNIKVGFSTVSGGAFHINGASLPMNNSISQDETTPIVIVVPGLASSSTSHVSSFFFLYNHYSRFWQFHAVALLIRICVLCT